jgi:hypothetical protein
MDENDNQPIGDPQPIEPGQDRKLLKRAAGTVMLVAGSFVAFAALLAPTRISGASRSARLLWQQRQKEIQATIEHERGDSVDGQKSASTNSDTALKQ